MPCKATASCALPPGWTTTSPNPSGWMSSSAPSTGSPLEGEMKEMPDPVIDRATLDTLASTTDKEFVGELIDTFLEDAPSLLDSLMTTLAAQDAEGFRRAAHSLKSNGASLGAMSFSASAKELEMIGKAGDLSGAEAMVESLRAEFEQVTQALKDYKHEA